MAAIMQSVLAFAAPQLPSVPSMHIRGLSGKIEMPTVGLGTANFKTPQETHDAVALYLKNGGRMIHAARMYCNQKEVGRAIKESGIPRSELFVITMVPQWYLGTTASCASLNASLQELGLGFVDLVMMHWPGMFGSEVGDKSCTQAAPLSEPPCKSGSWSWKSCRLETWASFVGMQRAGLARAIGVSNFETWMLDELTPPPAVNQLPYHVGSRWPC